MTPEQEQIVERYGQDAVNIFNIARGHSNDTSPCTCYVCRVIIDKVSQWLVKHDAKVKERKP